ncbi:UDP-N-acetylmuramoyl-L-alanine--D-glutamate ligase [Veillonella sp. CHU110]|uniref:UDP-N-acetylmuramoyl-L-alanine--D-glutamate ligase n=1 Tax=Veillonella sp. CHU110 TaxID=2490947 RepID=UPI000F8E69B6|nr:UDP-N-acetylmuramoyl-L-alanine--D-glutamate ligase [Veillonella sp. CHU110]
MDYTGSHILVLGAGLSGIGVAHTLAKLGATVTLNDYKQIEFDVEENQRFLDDNITVITGQQDFVLLDNTDRVVVSPGISLEIPIICEAKKRNIPVVGEVEIAYEVSKAPILGVTGTNGKTTTTSLLAAVLKEAEWDVYVGGNIGYSLSEQALAVPETGVLVAELSSYQLESIDKFRTKGAILLNVTPDHLLRHKTMERYQAAKENIFVNQELGDYTVLNFDTPIVADMAERVKGRVLGISQIRPVTDGAYFDKDTCYAVLHGQAVPVITTKDIHIPGSHNIENILSVIALTYALGVPVEDIYRAISKFHGVEHRLERIRALQGVTYYNDSKATNTDSTIKALESFTEPLILIAGGKDKMTDLEELMDLVKTNVKELILIGEAAQRFAEAAVKAGVAHIHRCESMEEAVLLSARIAEEGDIVLLSPACASFDWYARFEDRGDHFRRLVERL